jgi:hypothetical protein
MRNFMLQWIMGGRRSQHTPWGSDIWATSNALEDRLLLQIQKKPTRSTASTLTKDSLIKHNRTMIENEVDLKRKATTQRISKAKAVKKEPELEEQEDTGGSGPSSLALGVMVNGPPSRSTMEILEEQRDALRTFLDHARVCGEEKEDH